MAKGILVAQTDVELAARMIVTEIVESVIIGILEDLQLEDIQQELDNQTRDYEESELN